jgi:ATP synthase protein I
MVDSRDKRTEHTDRADTDRAELTDLDAKIRNAGRRFSARSGMFDAFGTAGMMGFHLLSGMLVGGFIGYWLDKWLDTDPWMKAVFFMIGIAAGFRNIYLDAQRLVREQEGKDNAWKGAAKKDASGSSKED